MNGTALASARAEQDLAGTRSSGAPLHAGRDPFVVRAGVGRLVEVQAFEIALPCDVDVMNATILAAAASLGVAPLLIADYRAVGPFSQDVGDVWSRAMRQFNAAVERSAILLHSANETFNLQITRVVRCAGSPRRRIFYEAADLRTWIAEVATPEECSRLDEILA
jgi:hypothetical protein